MRLFLRCSTLLALAGIGAWAQSPPSITGAVNAASGVSRIAPGMLAAVTGRALASSAKDCTANPLPVACNGVTVLVGGLAAPLLSVSPTEIDFQVPYGITGGSTNVQVSNQTSGGTLQSEVTVGVAPIVPGIFLTSGRGAGVGALTSISGAPLTWANPGDTVVVSGTGFGVTNPAVADGVTPASPTPVAASVTVTVGGENAPVLSAALVSPGICQARFTLPVSGVSTQSGLLIAVKD